MKRLSVIALVMITALVGCKPADGPAGDSGGESSNGTQPSGETITIAIAGPMTGEGAAYGAMIKAGAQLAMKEINAAGGIDGKMITLDVQDDKGDATEAASVARKLAGDTKIPIIVGHFNSVCTNKAKEEYNDVGVVSLSPGSTNVQVCKGYKWTFRNLYRDDFQGKLLARFIKEKLGGKKVAVFYENDDYGKGLRDFFLAEAKAIGLETLDPISYIKGRTQDYKSLVSQVVDQKPDTIFVSGLYNEGGLIAKAARVDLKMDVKFVGGDGLVSPGFIKAGGEAANGAYLSTPFYYDENKANDKAKAFYAAFKKEFNKDPDTWAALTYDAVLMAAEAIKAVGTDRAKIRDHLASITTKEKAFSGVTGLTYFDEEGDCKKPLAFVEVKDGKMVLSDKQMD